MKHVGSFVFNDIGDGCLTVKWVCSPSEGPYVECCKLLNGNNESEPFEGLYTTTWIESGNHCVNAMLTIKKDQINSKLYELIWFDNNKKVIFNGSGMLFNGLLIGHYWIK